MSRRSSIISSRSIKNKISTTVAATPKKFTFEIVRVYEENCLALSALVGYKWLEGEGVHSNEFKIGNERFSIKITMGSTKMITIKLHCHTASPKHPVYTQARMGLVSLTGDSNESKFLHCLFQKSAPWGKSLQILTLEKKNKYTAIRRVDGPNSEPTLSLKTDIVLKVVNEIRGEYHIRSLPIIEYPGAKEDLSEVLNGGMWGTSCGLDLQVETDDNSVSVCNPVWGTHCAFWSRGIDSTIPSDAVPHLYEFEIEISHPSEPSFEAMRVGVIPRSCFCQGTNAVLDFVAAIDQNGVSYVAHSADRTSTPEFFPDQTNKATVAVRVDQLSNTISWNVNNISWTVPVSLKSLAQVAAGDAYVPFVMLNYKDDVARWIRGGVIPFPEDDESQAIAIENAVKKIFEFADRNDDGHLTDAELSFLANRTSNSLLSSMTGSKPQYDDLLFHYSTRGGATADVDMLEHRMDPGSQLYTAKPCFSDPTAWDSANIEELEFPEKATRPDPDTGELKTRIVFLETHTEEQWFAAPIPDEADKESLPGDTAISINPDDL